MKEIEIYTRATITILGIAYPILLQVIARLDEKYASSHIVELFDNERSKKWFKILLISSLASIFIWSFKFKPLIQIDGLNYLINNSANILVLLNTTALVITFFLYVNKILIYYTPVKFINYLIQKHTKNSTDLKYFNALSDMFLLFIQKQNDNISQTISRFFYDAFRKEREKFHSKPVEYPETYYSLVYKTIEELAILKNKKNYNLEYRTSGGIWLLGELPGYEISETTYNWLWRNIILAVRYEQDDMIMYHWERAEQFYTYNLDYIYPEYERGNPEPKNKALLEKRNSERKRFLEFHYALGGLLLYKKRYNCIHRIFNFTNSQPPKYELLPESMSEIFNLYIEFRDPFESRYTWISNKYWFPEQSGLKADGIVKKWISSYLAVLFLRQYTIIPYLITMKPLENPMLPNTQGEKREWINSLDFFRKLVLASLENSDLIQTLNFNFLTKEWCDENDYLFPLEFIDNLKELLNRKYEEAAVVLPIAKDKIAEFYNTTTEIIENTYQKYGAINNKTIFTEDYNKWFVNGQRMVQSKDAFSETPEVHHTNYDSILASVISNSMRDGIASTFKYNCTKSYLIKPEDLFSAIERLEVNENYLIVTFGINLSHYINYIKVKGLTESEFNGLKIIQYSVSRPLNQSVFIVNNNDLPNILSCEIESEIINKYTLTKISKDYNIYASVLDLNNSSEEIRKENSQDKSEDELNKSMLLSIIQSTEIRWKKNIKLIQLIEYSEYREKGLPNKLNDIIPLIVKNPAGNIT